MPYKFDQYDYSSRQGIQSRSQIQIAKYHSRNMCNFIHLNNTHRETHNLDIHLPHQDIYHRHTDFGII